MLTREDIERIIGNVINERGLMSKDDLIHGLSIEVKTGDFTSPNTRTVLVKLNGDVIAADWFDVRETDEYEG